jgi:site-specific DNA recombinase
MQPQEKMKCAIYARVSTDQQGDSIDNQVSQCCEYISRFGDFYDAAELLFIGMRRYPVIIRVFLTAKK